MTPLIMGLLLAMLAPQAISSQAETRVFPAGRLVESVASDTSPLQRFTLYVPSTYSASRPAPVIYLMDPRSRGRVPAKLFQAAAERYGYILVSSQNTLSDGPPEVNLRALQAMWDDSHRWFAIDDRRVYIAGFSGTARMASLLARNRPEVIAGVISAGAGFHPDAPPSRDARFLYFGTVGNVDYNFHEIDTLEQSLVSLDLPHRIERFEGTHSWMPASIAMQAVEWLELRAMRSGTRSRDDALLEAWWTRDEEAARALIEQGRPLDAARRYAAMARDFEGLRDTAAVKALAERTASSPEAKERLKQRQAATRKFNEWTGYAMQLISNSFPEGASAPIRDAPELAQALEISRMKKTAEGVRTDEALEAQRRLNQIEVQLGFYLPHEAIQTSELTRAAYYLSLAVQIDESSPVGWYLTAESYAHLNARKEALVALRRAVTVGFRDLASIESDPAFRKLRADPAYVEIVELLKTSGDTLDLPTVDRPPSLR